MHLLLPFPSLTSHAMRISYKFVFVSDAASICPYLASIYLLLPFPLLLLLLTLQNLLLSLILPRILLLCLLPLHTFSLLLLLPFSPLLHLLPPAPFILLLLLPPLFPPALLPFLDAFSHLYKRVCPSIGQSVRPSVGRPVGPQCIFLKIQK